MNAKKRSRELLRASGLTLPPALPPIREQHEEQQDDDRPHKLQHPAVGQARPDSRSSPTVHHHLSPAKQTSPMSIVAAAKIADLPEHLRLLSRIWEAMLTGRGLLMRRKEFVTLQTLKPIVESYTGKQFKEQYVQQIKHLYPEAFSWQYVRIPNPDNERQLECHLLLRFERPQQQHSGAGQDSGARASDASARAALDRCLLAFHEQHRLAAAGGKGEIKQAADEQGQEEEVRGSGAAEAQVASPFAAKADPVQASPAALRVGASPGSLLPDAVGGPEPRVPLAPLPSRDDADCSYLSRGSSPHPSLGGGGRGSARCAAASPGNAATPSRSSANPAEPSAADAAGVAGVAKAVGEAASPAGPAGSGHMGGVRRRRLGFADVDDTPLVGSAGAGAEAGAGPSEASTQAGCAEGAEGSGAAGNGDAAGAAAARSLLRAGSGGAAGALGRQGSGVPGTSAGGSLLSPTRRPPAAAAAAAGARTPSSRPLPPAGSMTPSASGRLPPAGSLTPSASGRLPPAGTPSSARPPRAGSMTPSGRLPPAGSMTPTSSARRNPLLARLMSADTLEMLDKAEACLAGTPQAKARREQLQATTHLPQAFDLVRGVFGAKGPCVRPKGEVVAGMRDKSTHRGGVTMAEAQLQLELLAQEAPEFLRIEPLDASSVKDDGAYCQRDEERDEVRYEARYEGRDGPALAVRLLSGVDLDRVRKGLVEVAARAAAETARDAAETRAIFAPSPSPGGGR